MKKIRADQLLVEQNLAVTCTKACALIMSGCVYVGTEQIKKPSELFPSETKFNIKGKNHPYVGRGGVKLKAALDAFSISPQNKTCLDVGVSTGGFTDCLLQEGAKKVYAVDVGYGQLDWKLRQNSRVILFEKTNFRYFDVEAKFVEKGGIVRNELKRMECVQKITHFILENKMKIIGSIASHLLGSDGNQEYLLA